MGRARLDLGGLANQKLQYDNPSTTSSDIWCCRHSIRFAPSL